MSNKIQSSTIRFNRGVGDGRVRALENTMEQVVGGLNNTIGRVDEIERIVFVSALPANPDPEVIYFVTE